MVPSMALQVVDRAIQAFGAEGVSQDQELAAAWAGLRTLRLADVSNNGNFILHPELTTKSIQGPDEVCSKNIQTCRRILLTACF